MECSNYRAAREGEGIKGVETRGVTEDSYEVAGERTKSAAFDELDVRGKTDKSLARR